MLATCCECSQYRAYTVSIHRDKDGAIVKHKALS
uniref:Mobile element protein n=1 Tax=Ascaris lumbricoides TaxID=6252 RepID=A0A0M3ID28_ASCLU